MNVTLYIILGIVLLVAALFLIIAVLLQNGKSKGTGVVTGGAETFFGKSKAKSMDKKLNTLTIAVAIIFFVVVIAVFMIEKNDWFTPDTNTSTSTSTSTNSATDTSTDTSSNTVEHDHNNDGVPDHDADAHN